MNGEPTLSDLIVRFDRLDAAVTRLDLRAEALNLEMQRGFLALERRIGGLEETISDLAAHFWAHRHNPDGEAVT